MKAREKIYDSIKDMNPAELGIVYEQIRLIKRMKSALPKKKKPVSIEKIHELTSSSESNWTDAVIEDRKERL